MLQCLPFIVPGKRFANSLSRVLGDIQCPKTPSTPFIGVGIVSSFLGVAMTVLLSTLATSQGSVHAK